MLLDDIVFCHTRVEISHIHTTLEILLLWSVFWPLMSQKCFGGRGSAPDPLGELRPTDFKLDFRRALCSGKGTGVERRG